MTPEKRVKKHRVSIHLLISLFFKLLLEFVVDFEFGLGLVLGLEFGLGLELNEG